MKRLAYLVAFAFAVLTSLTGSVARAADVVKVATESANPVALPLDQALPAFALPSFGTAVAPPPVEAQAFTPPRATLVVTSVASGLWSATATWGGSVPGPTDDVVIADGTTVTIDVSTSVNSVTVGQGVSGVLQFEQTTARTLTVAGNVLVNAGGTFQSNPVGTVTTHQLTVSGGVTNNGTLDFSTNGNAAGAAILFTSAGSTTFGGTGGTTDIFTIYLNKGTSAANVLDVSPSNLTYKGNTTTAGTTAAYLRIMNGTFKISGTFTMSNSLFLLTGTDSIPATGGLFLNNPNYTVAGRGGSMLTSGQLRVDAGTLNVGTGAGNSLSFLNGSSIQINGGAVNCSGRLAGNAATNTTTYNQTGGTVTVCTVGNASGTLASFDLPTSGSSFSMSGGSIVVQLISSNIDYRNAATVGSIVGGTLQLGNASSGAPKEYWVFGQVPNLVITNTSANHSMRQIGQLNVWQNTTINTGTTLTMNTTAPAGQLWLQIGPTVTNNGTIVGNVAGSRLYFLGNGVAQTYTGNGTAGTGTAPLATLDIDNPLGVTINAASPTLISSRCDLLRGTLTNSSKLQLGIGGTSSATTQIGVGSPTGPGGNYDVAPAFNVGTGGYNLLYAPETVARVSGVEIPASRAVFLMSLTNPNGVTLTGGDATMTSSLTLTTGVLHTGSNTAIVPAPATVTRTTGYVDGNLRKDVPTGAPSRTFEIGDAANYLPVSTVFAGVTTPGTVTARTNPGDLTLPAGSGIDYSKSVNRNWTLAGGGGLAFGSATGTFNFVAGDVDGGANPANFEVRKLDGTTWTGTTAGARTATSTQATWNTGLSQFAIGELATYTILASAGPGGTIAPPGTTNVTAGGSQTYTITPDPCHTIADVLVDGVSVGPVPSYTFTNVLENHTIAASFVQTNYTITSTAGTGGSITPSGPVSVACGADRSFTIAANACHSIADVLVDGVSVGAVSSYTFTDVQANHTIAASFTANGPYTITASAGTGGSITPSGPVSVACGANQSFTIAADPCFTLADVLVDGVSVGAVTSYTFTDVQVNHTIAASFSPNGAYTITASAGTGGSITPSGAVLVSCGGDQSFTIGADPCYSIADVLVDGVSVGAVASYTFNGVTANHTIAASFTLNGPYTITASAGTGGSIAPSGPVPVACGADQSFTIAANPCFTIADVLVDGVSVGAVTSYTFNGVNANHTIAASFTQTTYKITATADAGGSIAPPGSTIVACGDKQSYTITADPGFAILDVLVDAVSVGAVTTYTFNGVNANHTIHATFTEAVPPSVTVSSPNGGETLIIGAQYALTWNANDNVGVTCVDLLLSRSGPGGPWETIATCVSNTGSYPWMVIGPQTTLAIFRVDAHDAKGNTGTDSSDQVFSIIEQTTATEVVPIYAFAIEQAAPNPMTTQSRIGFAIPRRAPIRLSVFDAQGREVAVLASGPFESGRYTVSWNGQGEAGRLASGVYFLRFHTPDLTQTRRIVLQR